MGTDIHGWVEVKVRDGWQDWAGIIRIDELLHRHSDGFASLFGVSNYVRFRPLAGGRGLPDDASEIVKNDEWVQMSHSHTWISWNEIQAIDWDEEAEDVDRRVSQYKRDETGKWKYNGKTVLLNPPPIDVTKEGKTQVGDTIYEVRRMKRIEARTGMWALLFDLMHILAKQYGDDKVRLVVYFDS